ncbi:copper resistance protein NlpE [Geoalkalibacter sp.]|uniref:copper resistance protein NlpE n=1 Tax=Geoalkalibacter sp. TaxID=3041440 RepID=UPI00272E8322|nr:copper resistance protein NlpE [Geoalkalibacter sp.]
MKNLRSPLILLILAWFGAGCAPQVSAPLPPVVDGHTSRIALDWPGVYAGVLPCADCAGIDTRLRLNADLTYVLETRYLGKDERVFARRGFFVWAEDGNIIHLRGLEDGPVSYRVGENRLFQLDRQGRGIEGPLAETYVLNRAED